MVPIGSFWNRGCHFTSAQYHTPQQPDFPGWSRTFHSQEPGMTRQPRSPFLTIAEAAELLRLKKHTLDNMRWQGTGPPFRKHGGRIFYHRDELTEWSKNGRRKSSSGR